MLVTTRATLSSSPADVSPDGSARDQACSTHFGYLNKSNLFSSLFPVAEITEVFHSHNSVNRP